jgi:hypothetical protein
MNGLYDLLPLLVLLGLVGLWLKLSRAREMAVAEARRQCERHGLQLLDETVGLAGVALRRVDGLRRVERCYAFEVSIDGNDRQAGRLWMIGSRFTGVRLPTITARDEPAPSPPEPAPPAAGSNVVPLRRRSDPSHRER